MRRFETGADSAKDPPAAKSAEDQIQSANGAYRDCELRQEQRHRQLLYEIGKMRSVLLHSLDHTLSADAVDDIIEASEKTASEYVAELLRAKGGRV